MSTKPATIPTWAVDANYTGGDEAGTDTKTDPGSSRRNEGWEPGSRPPAQFFNWWQNLVGQWTEYVNDGVFEGPIQIAGDLDVTDDLSVGDELQVGGECTIGAKLTVSGDFELEGNDYHGDRVLNIPGSAGITKSASERDYEFFGYTASIDIKTLPATSNTTVTWPIPLRVGDRIKSVTFRVLSINTGIAGEILAADIARINADGSATSMGSTTATPSTVSVSSVTVDTTDTVLGANQHFFAGLVMSPVQDNETGMRVYGVDVTYDRPAP